MGHTKNFHKHIIFQEQNYSFLKYYLSFNNNITSVFKYVLQNKYPNIVCKNISATMK